MQPGDVRETVSHVVHGPDDEPVDGQTSMIIGHEVGYDLGQSSPIEVHDGKVKDSISPLDSGLVSGAYWWVETQEQGIGS